jgi:undecaprenyl-diphosphatase
VGTGAVLERVFKALVTRTPDNLSKLYDASPQDLAQIAERAHTFPSGHVIGAATLLGMIAVCASVGRRLAVRTTWAAFVLFGVLFVAALALYVHAHLFADVIGGMALGGSIVAAGAALINALQSIERRRRPTRGR